MSKTKHPGNPSPPTIIVQEELETDELWQQLQAAWDEHSRRVDEIIAHSDRPLFRINSETLKVTKRRILIADIILTLFCTVIAVSAAIAVIRHPDSILRRLYCIAAAVSIAAVCIMSIGPHSPKVKSHTINALPTSKGNTGHPPFDTALLLDALATQRRYSVLQSSSLKSLATIMAATTVFVFAACTPAGNESKTTAVDTTERMETIAIIDSLTANNTQP